MSAPWFEFEVNEETFEQYKDEALNENDRWRYETENRRLFYLGIFNRPRIVENLSHLPYLL